MSTPTAVTTSRRSVARWTVAAIATGALVVSGTGLVAFAQSGAGESQGPVFVPAGAAAYVEARLDMPGGQGEALAEMMTAFPGFADAGSFDMKVDEAIAGLGAQMNVAMPEGDLLGDVLTGEIGLGLSDLESAMMGGEPSMIIGAAVADAAAAGSLIEALMAQASDTTTSSYNDITIYTDTSSSPPMSLAMHADWVLLGTAKEVVTAAIDVLDGETPSLADDADFATAWARLPDARLAAAYMDFAPFAGFLDMAAMMAEGETGMAMPEMDLAGLLPGDMVGSLVAEADRMHLEILVTPAEMWPETPVGESELSLVFPADTQMYIETRALGAAIEDGLNQVVTMLEAQDMSAMDETTGLGEIEMLFGEESPITAMLGVPLPEFLDFVGDAGVGAGISSDGLWMGIAADVLDAEAADERVTSLMTILRMFLVSDETMEITIDTSEVAGVEVTTITLPADEMLAQSGLPLSIGDSIDVALTDDTLLIGLGDFVENAIIGDPADSLGASAGFTDAIGQDTVNSGLMYMNLSSLLTALDPMLEMMSPDWEMIAPYATGLDRMVAVGTVGDEVLRARMSVIVVQ